MLAGFAVFEVGNVAATLLILRATDVLTPGRGIDTATQIAIALYVVYNIAATITSFPAGGLSDKLGRRGPLLVTVAGVAAFAPAEIRGSAFGLLATVQAIGNVAASAVLGLQYTVASPAVTFGYLAA